MHDAKINFEVAIKIKKANRKFACKIIFEIL